MNAIPQKVHKYSRVSIPRTPPVERTRPYPKVEYIDEVRARRMAAQKRNREVSTLNGMERERRSEPHARNERYDAYYRQSRKRQENERAKSYERINHIGERRREAGRKLTPAYEVGVRKNSPQSRRVRQDVHDTNQARRETDYGYKAYTYKRRPAQRRTPEIVGYDMGTNTGGTAALPRRNAQLGAERSAAPKKGVASTIVLIIAVFVILAFVLMMHAKVSEATHVNARLDSNITELNRQLDKVKMDIALEQDLSNIQERAEALGMSHPKDEQIEFVELEEDGYIETEEVVSAGADTITDGTGDGQEIEENAVADADKLSIEDKLSSWFGG